MSFTATDCCPLEPQPSGSDIDWLRRLAKGTVPSALAVSLSSTPGSDEPIVYCDQEGYWRAGRYIGSVAFEGRVLTITPRLGMATLRSWLSEVFSVVLTQSPGQLCEDESFIVELLALVWAQTFVKAARHGLPSLRRKTASKGSTIRGCLDVSASIRNIAAGLPEVVSIRLEKSLDHAATRAIVAAYGVLHRSLATDTWLPARLQELLPHLLAVVGSRPVAPTKIELSRIRYTPITAGFAPLAELSLEIAKHRGLFSRMTDHGETQGVLLDVAELWELYVLSVLRKAAAPLTVRHGSREFEASKHLLVSEISGQGLGTLIPDAIITAKDGIRGVVDAKYKSIHPTAQAVNGPQREDLYQMAAYLARFSSSVRPTSCGLLVYPLDPNQPAASPAERNSPWVLDSSKRMAFAALPHDGGAAIQKMRSLVKGFYC